MPIVIIRAVSRTDDGVTDLVHSPGPMFPEQFVEGQPYFVLPLSHELFLGVAQTQAVAQCGFLAENTATGQLSLGS